MRVPRAKLHRPVAALRRLQYLAGWTRSANNDRNRNRWAQLDSALSEMFDLAMAAQDGGPLPEPVDHSQAV